MSLPDETLAAAAAILRGLAKGSTTSPHTNGLKLPPYKLPGNATAGKEDFEAEIAALARRISYLESRADVVSHSLPDTPGELQNPASPSSRAVEARGYVGEIGTDMPADSTETTPSHGIKSKRVNNLLAARDSIRPSEPERTVSEDDIGVMREHVDTASGADQESKRYHNRDQPGTAQLRGTSKAGIIARGERRCTHIGTRAAETPASQRGVSKGFA